MYEENKSNKSGSHHRKQGFSPIWLLHVPLLCSNNGTIRKKQDQFMVRKMWNNWQWNKWWFNIFKENHFWGIKYLHLAIILSTKPICIRKKMKSFKCETYQERSNHCIQRYFAFHCRWKLATWKDKIKYMSVPGIPHVFCLLGTLTRILIFTVNLLNASCSKFPFIFHLPNLIHQVGKNKKLFW